MRETRCPPSCRQVSARQYAVVCLAVLLALSAVACEDEQAPSAPPVAEPQSLRSAVPNTWTTKSPIPMAAGAVANGQLFVISGFGGGSNTDVVEAYTP